MCIYYARFLASMMEIKVIQQEDAHQFLVSP